jgi:hypothetical protein
VKAIAMLLLVAAPALAAEPAGSWLGQLDAGAAKLRVGFHVEKKPDGTFTSTLASHSKTSAPREYATIEETFAADAIDEIRAFVLAR